jgi:hypothetical protein
MGCGRPARERGLCWAHVRRQRRNADLSAPIQQRHPTPIAMLTEAALNYAEAEALDDEAYRRATTRLRVAARRYVLACSQGKHRRKLYGVRADAQA